MVQLLITKGHLTQLPLNKNLLSAENINRTVKLVANFTVGKLPEILIDNYKY